MNKFDGAIASNWWPDRSCNRKPSSVTISFKFELQQINFKQPRSFSDKEQEKIILMNRILVDVPIVMKNRVMWKDFLGWEKSSLPIAWWCSLFSLRLFLLISSFSMYWVSASRVWSSCENSKMDHRVLKDRLSDKLHAHLLQQNQQKQPEVQTEQRREREDDPWGN